MWLLVMIGWLVGTSMTMDNPTCRTCCWGPPGEDAYNFDPEKMQELVQKNGPNEENVTVPRSEAHYAPPGLVHGVKAGHGFSS